MMQDCPRQYVFQPLGYSGGAATTATLNSTDDWLAWVFPWRGGDFTKCAFVTGATVTGSPVLTAQLFNVSASDGLIDTGSAIGSAVDSAALAASTVYQVSGIGQTALAAGVYGLRLIFKSGTSAQVRAAYVAGTIGGGVNQFPYHITVTDGAAQTLVRSNTSPIFAVGGSSFVHIDGVMPPCVPTAPTAWASTSNPDEYGIWFQNPYPVDLRICGADFFNNSGSRPDIRMAAYSGSLASPTASVTKSFDRDQAGAVASNGWNYLPFDDSDRYTLLSGAFMGLGIRAASAHNLQIYYLAVGSGNEVVLDSLWGQNAYMFTRNDDAGALTATQHQVPLIFPKFDGMEVELGSGSGSGSGDIIVNATKLICLDRRP